MNGTGFFYSRFGEHSLFGDFYRNINENVAIMQDNYEITTSENKFSLVELDPKILKELQEQIKFLEKKYKEPIQGIFSVKEDILVIDEIKKSNLKGKEQIESTINMYEEGLINRNQFIKNTTFSDIKSIFTKELDSQNLEAHIKGDSGSRGIAFGRLESDKIKVLEAYKKGEPAIYVTQKPGSEDMIVMKKSAGMIMSEGDPTSHPVILAKSNNIPCVINLPNMKITNDKITFNGKTIKIGSEVTIDGSTGRIYCQKMKIKENNDSQLMFRLNSILKSDNSFKVYVNADSAEELRFAQELGAEGLGLCRTEHMVFETRTKLNNLRSVLFSKKDFKKNLDDFINYQKEDFKKIYSQAGDQRVVIRLLDPPINEFLPTTKSDLSSFLSYSQMSKKEYLNLEKTLLGIASHLGIRGIRFGIIDPELYLAQVKAILEATENSEANILLPFISFKEEFFKMKKQIINYKNKHNPNTVLRVGAMIETPMSALESSFYAKNADFLSYGLNDLTMATYALERVGSETMIENYVDKDIIQNNPFDVISYEGMKNFLTHSINQAKSSNKDIIIGVCSEQVRDEDSLKFFLTLPIDYVSSTGQTIPFMKYTLARNEIND